MSLMLLEQVLRPYAGEGEARLKIYCSVSSISASHQYG
jgi:hypothetical protein